MQQSLLHSPLTANHAQDGKQPTVTVLMKEGDLFVSRRRTGNVGTFLRGKKPTAALITIGACSQAFGPSMGPSVRQRYLQGVRIRKEERGVAKHEGQLENP